MQYPYRNCRRRRRAGAALYSSSSISIALDKSNKPGESSAISDAYNNGSDFPKHLLYNCNILTKVSPEVNPSSTWTPLLAVDTPVGSGMYAEGLVATSELFQPSRFAFLDVTQ